MPINGCVSSQPTEWADGVETKECPVMYYAEFSPVFITYNTDRLPHAGGWADQPAVLMELVSELGQYLGNEKSQN